MKVASQPATREIPGRDKVRAAESPKSTPSTSKTGGCRESERCDRGGCGGIREAVRDTLRELFSGMLKGMDDPGQGGHRYQENSFDWLRDAFGGSGDSGPGRTRPSGSGRSGSTGSSGASSGLEPGTGTGRSSAAGSIDPYELAPHQKYSFDCGVTATRAALRAAGFDGDQDAILDDAIAKGYHTGRDNGAWTGPANMSKYLQSYGIQSENEPFSQKNIEAQLESGNPVIVSTDRHYFVISGKDENGNYIVGDTGTVVNKGTAISYSDLAAFSGNHTLVTIDAQNPPEGTRSPASRL
ncbi:MAG: C39 family peptidase [Candidatus Eremiobacteraeota bacterium]|nr:C39 family peptidase [Candidatus Eremiobacteraeota bacterium]MCW5870620.1 C39 family peptidase [Candidatus Eremiobacteraeota bacterium]